MPSGADVVFLAVLYLLAVLMPHLLFLDASTGWHLVTGQYVLTHLQVPHRDLISYTFPDRPWVDYEWLFDTAAALLVRLGGLNLLGLAAASSIALLFSLLFRDARREGCHFLPALGLTLTGALASSVHWFARPHLFTFFGVYVFARVLEAFHRGELSARATLLVLGAAMLVWSNAHPEFLDGFAMVAIYLVSEAVTAAALAPGPERRRARGRAGVLLAALAITIGVSFANPYGAALYPSFAGALAQVGRTVLTAEFASPTFHGDMYALCLEALFAALAVGLAISRRRLWLGRLALVLAFAALALDAVRNVPLFAIVAVPAIAELFADAAPLALAGAAGAHASWTDAWRRGWERIGHGFDQMEFKCTAHLLPVAAVAVLAFSCAAAGRVPGVRPLVSMGFDPAHVPTTTLAYISEHHLSWNHGFSFDNWGGYIRYETGHRVFVDDRTDFYGRAFYQRYARTMFAEPGWETLLDEYGVQWVLAPRPAELAAALRRAPGWRLRAEDPGAYLFVRTPR